MIVVGFVSLSTAVLFFLFPFKLCSQGPIPLSGLKTLKRSGVSHPPNRVKLSQPLSNSSNPLTRWLLRLPYLSNSLTRRLHSSWCILPMYCPYTVFSPRHIADHSTFHSRTDHDPKGQRSTKNSSEGQYLCIPNHRTTYFYPVSSTTTDGFHPAS